MNIKKFESFESNDGFNKESAIEDIKKEFPESKVNSLYDDEILEWVDENWSESHESEYDWYIDHNNGEAQDVIIDQICDWYKTKHKLTLDQEQELIDAIKKEYYNLN